MVDDRCVRGAVDTDGIGNLVLDILGEIANGDSFRVRKHALKRLDESDTDGTNEKAHERGRVGGVRDIPCDHDSGLRLQPETPGKEASYARAEGLLELSMGCGDDLVGELESGKGSCSRNRVVRPLFAYLVGRPLKSAELVPFDECNDDDDEC